MNPNEPQTTPTPETPDVTAPVAPDLSSTSESIAPSVESTPVVDPSVPPAVDVNSDPQLPADPVSVTTEATSSLDAPTPVEAPVASTPVVATSTEKKPRKGVLIGLIIGLVVVIAVAVYVITQTL